MSGLTWTAIRRCYMYIEPGKPRAIRCPDCGATLFEIVEFASGGIRKTCRRCKDATGVKTQWLFVLYRDPKSYMDAVNNEKEVLIPELAIDKVTKKV